MSATATPLLFKSPFSDAPYPVTINKSTYNETDDIALVLETVDPDSQEEEVYAVASVCMPNLPCMPGHTYIKTYSENEGILEFLIENKIVERAEALVPENPMFVYVKVLI